MAVIPFCRPAPYPQLPTGLPCDVQREMDFGFHRAFPRDLAISSADPGLWLRYKVLLRESGEDLNGVTCHELVDWITDRSRRIGFIRDEPFKISVAVA